MDEAGSKYRTDEKCMQSFTGKRSEEMMWKIYMGG